MELDPVSELPLGEEILSALPRGLQDRPSGGNPVARAPVTANDLPDEILVRPDLRNMREHHFARALGVRGSLTPGRRVEDDAVGLLERVVELPQNAELVRAELPGARVADEAGPEQPVHADAETRPVGGRARGEEVLVEEDPARSAAIPVEEVAVHTCERRLV